MRRNFWFKLMAEYAVEKECFIDKLSLIAMFESIGSSFSEETIKASFWTDNNKTETEDLEFELVFETIEKRNGKHQTKDRIVSLAVCPFCKKPMAKKLDVDVISHVALCCHEDLDANVEQLGKITFK
jgi:phosphatidylserine decarboxylase